MLYIHFKLDKEAVRDRALREADEQARPVGGAIAGHGLGPRAPEGTRTMVGRSRPVAEVEVNPPPAYRMAVWHIGAPAVEIGDYIPICVRADGEELYYIRQYYENIPSCRALQENGTPVSNQWYGDIARFIVDHLPWRRE